MNITLPATLRHPRTPLERGDGALVEPAHPQQWACVPCAPVVLMLARCAGPSLCTAQARVSDHATSVSFFLGWSLLIRSTWPVIVVVIPSHFEMERSLFLGEEAQEWLPISGASLGHRRCGACPSLPAGLRYATKVCAMTGSHHLDGSQQAFRTGPALLDNLGPYQRRALPAGQCGVEVEGGRVPTCDWFRNVQILTCGGFRCAVIPLTPTWGGM